MSSEEVVAPGDLKAPIERTEVAKLPRVMLIFAVVITAIVGGISGLIAVLAIIALLYFFGGWDSEVKHGISDKRSCRLGGVILIVYPVCALGYQVYVGNPIDFSAEGLILCGLSLGIFCLGFYEDLTSALSARVRLLLMLVGAAFLVSASPGLVVAPLGVPFVDVLLQKPLFAYPMTILALTYLPNAFNVADGANGLLSGICLLCLYGLMRVDPGLHIWPLEVLFTGCLIFFILNVFTGRLFLGDGGAYFLGLLIGITLILTANRTDVSPWFLALLVFYPSTDFLFSMIRRILSGRSAMSADNEHFHNLLYRRIKSIGLRSMAANTITGLSIALVSSGIPIFIMEVYGAEINWFLAYITGWLIFLLVWCSMKYTEKPIPSNLKR